MPCFSQRDPLWNVDKQQHRGAAGGWKEVRVRVRVRLDFSLLTHPLVGQARGS